jgi:phosphohistidine phosphatase SixA/8-oxo-dGTP pyrophosphatase MutT (NUDIX family)
MSENENVKAAGAIVWRRNSDDEVEMAIIHRPKYDDWSLPKGKSEFGESPIATAYRELVEETGFNVRIGRYLGKSVYTVSEGSKTVDYWSAKFLGVVAQPDSREVDDLRWITKDTAKEYLTRDSDLEIIERFSRIDLDAKCLILLRHAKATPRTEWSGDDVKRPLSEVGYQQSGALVTNLIPLQVQEIHSSIAVRCYETIDPLAKHLSINYFFTDSLSEDVYSKNEKRVFKYIDKLLDNQMTTLVCSHNPILPHYLQYKLNRQGFSVPDTFLKPGDAWLVHHISTEIVAVDKLDAPTIL